MGICKKRKKRKHNTENSLLSSSGLFLPTPQKDGLAIPEAATRGQSFRLGQQTTQKFLRRISQTRMLCFIITVKEQHGLNIETE